MRTVRVVFILLLAKVTVVTLYVLYEKKCKQLVIDDTSDEDQLPEPWIWKEIRNSPKIWNYTKTPGIKEAALQYEEYDDTWFPVDVDYRIEIAESLLKNMPKPDYKEREQFSYENIPEKLHAKH
ncbi:hypothetical protein K0M31_012529 [Melipona bicolor]|uniref:Uncharacterized protein n=1 Tax=Melipona bicolor TaxID=60889 RepID=A0AA40FJD2_9HYME|nr:hypothetical protein K0M31_012529 [Melipona bicolor]